MGIKDLWTLLTPHCEKKPLYELSGKVIAVDLAGWVCEALTIVEYQVHPRFYLRNLFFRTCHLLLMDVYPLFVLEGQAPELKLDTMSQRNQLQFKGSRPTKQSSGKTQKDRKRFNSILGQCQKMLNAMGLLCVKGLGEAEATCAYLYADGVVDGCVTQDSDCFAYGARVVYRNFCVTNNGNCGSVDVYNLNKIDETFEFGRNKMVVLALLCGCDYDSMGVPGVGRDSALKFLNEFNDGELLDRIRKWRDDKSYFEKLERDVNDANKCTSCGHDGKIQKHSRSGCGRCGMTKGCDANLYKEERLIIKNELQIRQKALENPNFPNEEIIREFLNRQDAKFHYDVKWNQPNLAEFVAFTNKMIDWEEIYAVEKLFPILTRWQMLNADIISQHRLLLKHPVVKPKLIKKKRHLKGIYYYEIVWDDADHFYITLIPTDQMNQVKENCKSDNIYEIIFSTNEPVELVEKIYPSLVDEFFELKNAKKKKPVKEKPEKVVRTKKKRKNDDKNGDVCELMNDLSLDIPKKTRKIPKKKLIANKISTNQGTIDQFVKKLEVCPEKINQIVGIKDIEKTRESRNKSDTLTTHIEPTNLHSINRPFDHVDRFKSSFSNHSVANYASSTPAKNKNSIHFQFDESLDNYSNDENDLSNILDGIMQVDHNLLNRSNISIIEIDDSVVSHIQNEKNCENSRTCQDNSISYFFPKNNYRDDDVFEESFNNLCGKSLKINDQFDDVDVIDSDDDEMSENGSDKSSENDKSNEKIEQLADDSFGMLLDTRPLYERIGFANT